MFGKVKKPHFRAYTVVVLVLHLVFWSVVAYEGYAVYKLYLSLEQQDEFKIPPKSARSNLEAYGKAQERFLKTAQYEPNIEGIADPFGAFPLPGDAPQ